jgi:hypothetical protein
LYAIHSFGTFCQQSIHSVNKEKRKGEEEEGGERKRGGGTYFKAFGHKVKRLIFSDRIFGDSGFIWIKGFFLGFVCKTIL